MSGPTCTCAMLISMLSFAKQVGNNNTCHDLLDSSFMWRPLPPCPCFVKPDDALACAMRYSCCILYRCLQ